MICSAKVVPERGMPTMKTGAGSRFCARGPYAGARWSKQLIEASTKRRCASRENGWNCPSSRCPSTQWAKARSGYALLRPELRQVELRHDAVLGNETALAAASARSISLGALAGARGVVLG